MKTDELNTEQPQPHTGVYCVAGNRVILNSLTFQVNEILAVTDPTKATALNSAIGTLGMVTVTNSGTTDVVSTALGTETTPNYDVGCIGDANPIATGDAANIAGLNVPACVAIGASNTQTSAEVALPIKDFNLFRLRVVDAIDTLDTKIRDILAIVSLTC